MTVNTLSFIPVRNQQSALACRSSCSMVRFGIKPGARFALLPLADQVQEMPMREIKRRLDFMAVRHPNNKFSVRAQDIRDSVLSPAVRAANIFFWNSCIAAITGPLAWVFLVPIALVHLYKAIQGNRDYTRQMRANYQAMLQHCKLPADFAIPPKSAWKTAVFPLPPGKEEK